MLSFYFLFLRQAEIKVSDFLSIPNGPNLAISKPSGMQTKSFKTSVRPLAKATLWSLIFLSFPIKNNTHCCALKSYLNPHWNLDRKFTK